MAEEVIRGTKVGKRCNVVWTAKKVGMFWVDWFGLLLNIKPETCWAMTPAPSSWLYWVIAASAMVWMWQNVSRGFRDTMVVGVSRS